MRNALFEGVGTALVTPFVEGKVNFPMVDLLIRRQILAGTAAVILAGTTGEAPTLTDEEKLALFARGVQTAEGRCKIIAGTGSNDTAHAVRLSQQAQEVGVDGLLVVTPYYNKTSQQGLLAHYSAICQAVSIPVVVYHVPARTGMKLTLETCRRLAEIPGIAGIKEASGDLSRVARIIGENGDRLPVWSGNDDQAAAVMAMGGHGVISVASNVFPMEMNALVQAALSGDYEMARAIQRRLLPLFDLLFSEVNPIPVKAAMGYLGYDVGIGRLPLAPPGPELKQRLHDFFRQWKESQ